jgi:hypothetical protein
MPWQQEISSPSNASVVCTVKEQEFTLKASGGKDGDIGLEKQTDLCHRVRTVQEALEP